MFRTVVFILRAVQSRNESFRRSGGVTNYQQTILGLGIVSISTDLLAAFRCLLVNASYGPERYPESPAAETEGCLLKPAKAGDVDRSRERFWIRRISDALLVPLLAALAIGIVANATYSDTLNNASKARRTYVCRYAFQDVFSLVISLIIGKPFVIDMSALHWYFLVSWQCAQSRCGHA